MRNGVRKSLIPVLISFLSNREVIVKWHGELSCPKTVTGGGMQGGSHGILEYLSQTANSLWFLDQDEGYCFVDDKHG